MLVRSMPLAASLFAAVALAGAMPDAARHKSPAAAVHASPDAATHASPATRPDAGAPPLSAPDQEELFLLRIDIGRRAVLIERAMAGLGVELPFVLTGIDDGPELTVLWRALREAGREGVILKELACARGNAPRKACRAFKLPAWIQAEPTPVPPLSTLRQYEEELGERFDPFVDAGCKAGMKSTKDRLYCSVE